jgi:hypothetical protein
MLNLAHLQPAAIEQSDLNGFPRWRWCDSQELSFVMGGARIQEVSWKVDAENVPPTLGEFAAVSIVERICWRALQILADRNI